jgi:pectinesterase
MATTSNQPLLGNPKTRSVISKTLLVVFSFAAFIGTIAIVSFTFSDHVNQPFLLKSQSHYATKLQNTLQRSLSRIQDSIEFAHNVNRRINDPNGQAALADCLELMDLSMDRVFNSMVSLQNLTSESHSDVHTWLSSVLTNHVTCLDGLTGSARIVMEHSLHDLIERARKSLAYIVKLSPTGEEPKMAAETLRAREFPSWVTRNDRKLLQSSGKNIQANVVVAKDGSGKYSTVQAAVTAAPDNSKSRYVIYVKKGVYKEQVTVVKSKKNLMIVGDGMDATTITGSLNVVDGSTTFNSATVIAVADGFIAQDIGFQNTAGAIKHQAVALRVGADQSVINRVKLDAFQDTLYAHSLRQFYRDCYITGTVDFIFGDAAMVIQNSQIVARKPMSGQNNMCTAQGRTDPNSNTGISIQRSSVIASADLRPVKGSVKTFLGRPWKVYSRTVYMQSSIGDHIDPTGWAPWDGTIGLNTLYYGEYMNTGPGAGTGGRVKWGGYHVITSAAEASKFTVAQFIQGGVWLKNTGVTYTEGL